MTHSVARRNFLRWGLYGSGSVLGMKLASPAAAWASSCGATPTFRALVCIEQLGGCDSFLFASPTDAPRKAALIARRGTGLTSYYNDPQLLHLGYGQMVALHPGLYPLQPYIGNLRVTLGALHAMHATHSRSHEIAQLRMALGTEENGLNNVGWMARMYDSGAKLIGFLGAKEQDFFCQSAQCKAHPPLVATRFEDFKIEGTNFHSQQGGANNAKYVSSVLRELSSMQVSRPVTEREAKYREAMASMFSEVDSIQGLLTQYTTPLHDQYLLGDTGYNSFANKFRNVAQYLKYMRCTGSSDSIVFVVPHGGYDMHSGYAEAAADRMSQLGGVLRTFLDDLVAMGVFNNVVVTTMTDFGRRIGANGSGLDHGDGHTVLTLGGKVKGGSDALYGEMPSAELLSTADAFPAAVDSRALISEIIQKHLGMDPFSTAFPAEIGAQFTIPNLNLLA